MRFSLSALLLLSLCFQARATDKAELDQRIRELTAKFEVLQAKPDKRVPAQNLREAQGIVLLDCTKAGFGFAYQAGSGLVMVKEPKSGQWSAPSFLRADQASFGFQAGGRQSFVVVLLMNTNTTHMFTEPICRFGGEASGTAGNASGTAQGTISPQEQRTMVYSDAEGFYGGVAVKGGSLSPDAEANVAYYGQSLTPKDILFDHKAKPSEAAIQLAKKITEFLSK